MRKLILISALLLASATAQAGQTRNLVLASNEEPKAVETARPAEAPAATADVKTEPKFEARPELKAEPGSEPKAEVSKPAKPVKKTHARRYEGDESKARRIAARYGVYW